MPTIDSITLHRYRLPLEPPFRAAWDPQPRAQFDVTLVRVTAGGREGVGAGDPMPGFAGNEALFVGHDPADIERHVRIIENLSFHYGRMWPLDVAMWDLLGQIKGEPLWRMLGAASPRVRLYASTGERLDAAARAESTRRLRDAGFPALKLRFHAADRREDIAVVRAVRDAIGDSLEILVDANQGWRMPWDASEPWSYDTAADVARQLADLGVYWLEEPLHRHDFDGMARLRASLGGGGARPRMRIAGGEGARELAELRTALRLGSLDVYQPDVAWSTGVLRATEFAAEVRDAGAIYSPHTWGDGIVLLANLHVAAAASNAAFVEYPYDPPAWTPERRDFVLPTPTLADDGYVTLSDAPGLGVRIDWHALERWQVA